jgi:hypothetical protein
MARFTVTDPNTRRYWYIESRGAVSQSYYEYARDIRPVTTLVDCYFNALQIVWPDRFPILGPDQILAGLRPHPTNFRFLNRQFAVNTYDWGGTMILVAKVE